VDGTPNDPNDPAIPIRDRADPEVMLDIEVAGAVAPGARLVVYFAQFTERGWVEAITKAVHDEVNRPSVISISWGFAEFEDAGTVTFTPQVMEDINRTLREAALLGVTVIVAAGDDGSCDGVLDGNVHVDFPSSSPFVLACGGTTLFTQNGRITDEVVWGDGIRADSDQDRLPHGSTGGGVSEHFDLPPWQQGNGIEVPPSASTNFAGRGVPDVAAVADGRTGYTIRVFGQDVTGEGGTSAVAPLWAGLIARINQQLAQMPGAKAVGYFNPLLYQKLGPTSAFNDITRGSNDAHGDLGAYSAGPGWDPCTGWGSPNGVNLLLALTGGVAPHHVGIPAPLVSVPRVERDGRPVPATPLDDELRAERTAHRQLIETFHRLVSMIPPGQRGSPRDPG
jgi:kumamolisin